MRKTKLFILAQFVLCVAATCQKPEHKIIKTFPVSGSGGWDYLAINKDRLYVSHSSQVNVLDKTTGDSLAVIDSTTGVHGIAFINELNKGFISDGRANAVTVFNLETNARQHNIPTGQNPDAIFYDSFSNRIYTCNGGSNDITVIDPVAETVVATITVGGKPETAVSDGAGKLFVNVEDKNEIVEVDLNMKKVTQRWSLNGAEGPTGLVLDRLNHRLFSSCEKTLVVMNSMNGKIVAKVPIGEGCDGDAFDDASKNIYTSNGEGTLTVIHQATPDKYTVVETITTKKGARTIALDSSTHQLYLPTSDFQKATSSTERPKLVPGTFQVLVIGKVDQ
ncbi:MAG: YncE family protein [Ginsengibacter sp.]